MACDCGKSPLKTLFLGNHTVGVVTIQTLLDVHEVVGAVVHPKDKEDGVRYESVHDYCIHKGIPVVRGKGKDANILEFIIQKSPDLIWTTDYRYLLPPEVLAIPPLGGVNLHPSLLPKYRGRAPINWAILNGETDFGLTAHVLTEGMDDGDILGQESFKLDESEDVGDALNKLYPLYRSLTFKVATGLVQRNIQARPQDERLATVFPARRPKDGIINWDNSPQRVKNLVRAVAPPYPGAFTWFGSRKITINQVELAKETTGSILPGTVIRKEKSSFTVACSQQAVKVIDFDAETETKEALVQGVVLGLGE